MKVAQKQIRVELSGDDISAVLGRRTFTSQIYEATMPCEWLPGESEEKWVTDRIKNWAANTLFGEGEGRSLAGFTRQPGESRYDFGSAVSAARGGILSELRSHDRFAAMCDLIRSKMVVCL